MELHWKSILLGEEDWWFLLQVPVRVLLMFVITLVTLRVIGKRGRMKGVFEILLIITLGSAAGDPLLYHKVGLLPVVLIFISVVLVYKIVNHLIARNKKVEDLLEGTHVKLISDGVFEIKNFKTKDLNRDDFFSDLRLKNVTQLGQVRAAYVEETGDISVFYFKENDVKTGLPIFPEILMKPSHKANETGNFACTFCGNVRHLAKGESNSCEVCHKKSWVKAVKETRIV